ncbi:PREDICTED: uncharacterized protein LOC109480375 [Branchiostoma belcheri]|uniref:3-oxoacyl-[acyl-carrier-protein] reductase n=1 Tax=Branchiostoma belcheri TaxID=7741 RepID=A0A6P5A8Q6_BRABE|nr:PREDICTED: uncharacterized protein LOC109480375 [Branchiostoma belcheri]XP_019638127.1 PREDICTED: uncharacterized protein LOC109480375 [Branchiostoma belcheri]XP_019638128.1 PREDICTED: uncharacterized protein LOC109480375 [Branchiostoma belcheri]
MAALVRRSLRCLVKLQVEPRGSSLIILRHMSQVEKPLSGKSALVTGSTSGIGLGIARALAGSGCNIVFTGHKDEAGIRELHQEFTRKHNVQANYIPAELTRPGDIEKLCHETMAYYPEGVNILINAAGIQHVCPIEKFPLERWDTMLSVMLTAPFQITKHLLPAMKTKGWGRIVNVSTVHGLVASVNKCAYVAAKHGLNGLTKVVALETAGTGVTCNSICPGWVLSTMMEQQIAQASAENGISWDEAKWLLISQKQPSMQFATIEQVSASVVYLCSPAADQMTGSCMTMDGGWTAQ